MEDIERENEDINWCEYSVYEITADEDFSEISELDDSELQLIKDTDNLDEALEIRRQYLDEGKYAVIKDNIISAFYEDQEIDNYEIQNLEAQDDDDDDFYSTGW